MQEQAVPSFAPFASSLLSAKDSAMWSMAWEIVVMAESSVYRPTKSCFGQSFYQTCFGQSSAAQEENVSVTVLALFLCSAKQRRDNERQFWSGQTRLCQRKESNRDCCPIFTVGLLDRLWLWCAVVHLYECRRRTAPPVLRFFQKDVFKKPTLTSSTGAAGFASFAPPADASPASGAVLSSADLEAHAPIVWASL